MMHQEDWMNLRAFKPLAQAGVSWAEIARLAGVDWRTAKKYLSEEKPRPPTYGPRPPRPKLIDPYREVIDEWIRREPRIRATTIYERLAADPYRFPGTYQRIKLYVARRRPELVDDPAPEEFFRRFESLPGAQAQVDWGDEGTLEGPRGPVEVSSFHMVLAYSRDPFCRYTTSKDLPTFWGCHREAFDHFGGVPGTILYDRTKTVVRRHVGRGADTPLHPEALAFSDHYGFSIILAAPYRPQTKGKVERMVEVTREKVLRGRTFSSPEEMQDAWWAWLPTRRAQVHRTTGEVIAVRAERDREALGPIPPYPYVVSDRHLRTVGRDALVSFAASSYSVPWTMVRPGQKVELRVTPEEVSIWTLGASPCHLATHPRATRRGSWVVDEAHWDGLPQGTHPGAGPADALSRRGEEVSLGHLPGAETPVARRDLSTYDRLFGTEGGSQ